MGDHHGFANLEGCLTRTTLLPALTAAALLCILPAAKLAAQAATPGSKAKALLDETVAEDTRLELLKLELALWKAIQTRDTATVDKLLAPDFKGTRLMDDGLVVASRAEYLASRQVIRSYLQVKEEIRSYGPVATVAAQVYLESRMPDGTERSGDFFIVDLWRKTGASWQLAARFSSPAEPKSK